MAPSQCVKEAQSDAATVSDVASALLTGATLLGSFVCCPMLAGAQFTRTLEMKEQILSTAREFLGVSVSGRLPCLIWQLPVRENLFPSGIA